MDQQHSFSSLKDLLSSPSQSNKPRLLCKSKSSPSSFSRPTITIASPSLNDLFAELSLNEPSSPSFSSSTCLFGLSSDDEKNVMADDEKDDEEIKDDEKSSSATDDELVCLGRAPTSRGRASSGPKMFPPPISCLKLFKKGKPFPYLGYNETDYSFARKEIRIPTETLFRASREGDRLQLYLKSDDEEEEFDNEYNDECIEVDDQVEENKK